MPIRPSRPTVLVPAVLLWLAAAACGEGPTEVEDSQVEADLALTGSVSPDRPVEDEDLDVLFTVSNHGPDAAAATQLEADLPESVTFGSATAGQGSCSDGEGAVACDLGELEPGASTELTVTLRPDEAGEIELGASVSAAPGDPDEDNNSIAVPVEVAPLGSPDCTELSFAASSAAPLDTVPVTGLPQNLRAPISAEVTRASEEAAADTGRTFVGRREDGEDFMIAPLVPGGDGGGGEVELRVTDGERGCPARTFTVDPLPDASGTFQAAVDSLSAVVDLMAEELGVGPDALEGSDLDTLPQVVWPLAVAREMIDGPDNPNSLRAVLEGSAPALDEEDVNTALTDRLLARAGVVEGLAAQLEEMRSRRGSAVQALGTQQSSATRVDCAPGAIDDPAVLDTCMGIQFSSAFDLREMADVRTAMGVTFGLAGLLPGAQGAAFTAGALLFLHGTVLEGTANLLPSEFVDGDFELSKQAYREDEPGPDEWHDARVRAASDGWSVEQTVLSAVLQVVGGAGAYDDYINGFMRESDVTESVLDFILTQLTQKAIDDTRGSDIVQIPADTTPEVVVDDPEWSRQEAFGDAVAFTDHRVYEPRQTGETEIFVGTALDRFPGDNLDMETKTVEVGRIDVDIDPPEAVVDQVGQRVEFTAEVTDAVDPSVAAEVTAGDAEVVATDGTVHTVRVTTPSDRALFPVLVSVRSTSDTGARAHADLPRIAQATIDLSGTIRVEPSGRCVEFGGTQQFTAAVRGLGDGEVEWSASAGSITDDGLFTAPDTEQEVVVTATSVVDPDVSGSAVAAVMEDCDEWFVASAFGQRWSGTCMDLRDGGLNGTVGIAASGCVHPTGRFIFSLDLGDDVEPQVKVIIEEPKRISAECPENSTSPDPRYRCRFEIVEDTEERRTIRIVGRVTGGDLDGNDLESSIDVTYSFPKP